MWKHKRGARCVFLPRLLQTCCRVQEGQEVQSIDRVANRVKRLRTQRLSKLSASETAMPPHLQLVRKSQGAKERVCVLVPAVRFATNQRECI